VEKGFRPDVIDAVLASGFQNPLDVYKKAEAISKTLKAPYFPQAWKVAERTSNILKGAPADIKGHRIDPNLLSDGPEKKLHEAYQAYQNRIETAKKSGDFALATSLYGEAFFDILNEFFEKVFVNAEDQNVRKNRLALLASVRNIFAEDVADLSKIDVTKN
jgi:glycyl-tRNA synthetase beta chain